MSVIDDIEKQLIKIGYRVKIKNLNASWYGSYTKRIRVIIAAVRKDLNKDFVFPEIKFFDSKNRKDTEFSYLNNLKEPLTIKDALKLIDYDNKNSSENDIDNKPMNHDKKSVEKILIYSKR